MVQARNRTRVVIGKVGMVCYCDSYSYHPEVYELYEELLVYKNAYPESLPMHKDF